MNFYAKLDCLLGQAREVCQGQILQLITKLVKCRCQALYNYGSWVQCYKTFFVKNLLMFAISKSVSPDGPFQSCLMFVGQAESLPLGEAFFRCSTWVDSSLSHKQTVANPLAYYEHSQFTDVKSFIKLKPDLKGASLGQAPDLLTTIRLGQRGLRGTKTLAYKNICKLQIFKNCSQA